jgi:hypothetical protein
MCFSTVWGRAIRPEVLQSSGVSAESLGLGAVYIGALRDEETALCDLLHLPEQSFVVAGLLVGWPAEGVQTLVRSRLPQNAVAFKNGCGPVYLKEAVATYERNFRAYREANGMKLKSWTFEVLNGATSLEYMDGRENMTAMLKGRGFPLK